MDNNYLYYRVDGGKALEAIQDTLKLIEAQNEARRAFCDRFGADGYVAGSRGIEWLTFEDKDKIPTGWNKPSYYFKRARPYGRSKEGRALLEEMRNLPLAGTRELNKALAGREFGIIHGTRIRSISAEKVGDKYVLHVPKMVERGPAYGRNVPYGTYDGCVRLKTSEYWAMKEAAGMDPDVLVQKDEE